ncbi:hypothetical protein JCM16303_005710 [Sporobolomyces ruberrimus]
MLEGPSPQAAQAVGIAPLGAPRLSFAKALEHAALARREWEEETVANRKEVLRGKYAALCKLVGYYARYVAACPTLPPRTSLWDLLKLRSKGDFLRRISVEAETRRTASLKEMNASIQKKEEGDPEYVVHQIAEIEIDRELKLLMELLPDVTSNDHKRMPESYVKDRMDLLRKDLDAPRKRLWKNVEDLLAQLEGRVPVAGLMTSAQRRLAPPPLVSESQGSSSKSLPKAHFHPVARNALL